MSHTDLEVKKMSGLALLTKRSTLVVGGDEVAGNKRLDLE